MGINLITLPQSRYLPSVRSELMTLLMKPPSTRYLGSKRRISPWIMESINEIKFDTFLDAFGGTGTIAYQIKTMKKKVTYNDNLKFNYHIGRSLIENNTIFLSEKDLEFIFDKHSWIKYPKFIQKTFKGIYYTDEENKWLDIVSTNIRYLNNEIKKSIAFNALCQSCIRKRPYNLFHRNNLYMRLARVKRNFYNKTTWEIPFEEHFEIFTNEINSSIFDNGRKNTAKNLDVFDLPTNFDMVYVDSPYMSPNSNPVDYRHYYHFLEGLANYNKWGKMINYNSSHRRFFNQKDIWMDGAKIKDSFDRLFKKFRDSTIVVSYKSSGIPSEYQIKKLLLKYKQKVITKRKNHQYVLSPDQTEELLFIAK